MIPVTEKTLNEYDRVVKHYACPSCRKTGKLIFHGYLRGYAETSSEQVIRGRRIFCNNRKKSRGCGKTFSLLLPDFIARCTITSATLSTVIALLLKSCSPAAVARKVLGSFSNRYIYGLLVRLRLRQSFLRSKLLTRHSYEKLSCADPLLQTLHHLTEAFPDEENPVSSFQIFFKTSFF